MSSACAGYWKQYLMGTWDTKAAALKAKKAQAQHLDYYARNPDYGSPQARSGAKLRVRKVRGVYIVERCYGGGLGRMRRKSLCGCSGPVRRRKKR